MKEFDLIDSLFRPIAGKDSLQFRDDCAWFEGYALTKDVLIAGVHFFPDDDSYNLARKALRVNISDLVASGAEPFGFMLGLALPKNTDKKWLERFAEGLKADIDEFDFQMLGGDTATHDGKLVISVTAIGKSDRSIIRGGAKEGENIFVTGAVGKGYAGLSAKKKSGGFVEWYDLPKPRVDMLPALRKYASAAVDVSDGLLADLWHICKESGLGAELHSGDIPLATNDLPLIELLGGGDDYEIIFTSSENEIDGCALIGRITGEKILKLDGKAVEPRGFEHS